MGPHVQIYLVQEIIMYWIMVKHSYHQIETKQNGRTSGRYDSYEFPEKVEGKINKPTFLVVRITIITSIFMRGRELVIWKKDNIGEYP